MRSIKRYLGIVSILVLLAACSGSSSSSEGDVGPGGQPAAADVSVGKTLYAKTCSSCHGPNAEGVEGLGKALASSTFIAGASDSDLVDLISSGRVANHPDNTTGVAMPPKGGDPSLSEGDLLAIVAYLRSLS